MKKYIIGLILVLWGVAPPFQTVLASDNNILTPLPLGYIKKGTDGKETIEVLPYLDLNRKEEVLGIVTGNFAGIPKDGGFGSPSAERKVHRTGIHSLVALRNLEDMNWHDAMEVAKEIKVVGRQAILPPYTDLMTSVYGPVDKFNATAKILRENNINADDLNTCAYWSSTGVQDEPIRHENYKKDAYKDAAFVLFMGCGGTPNQSKNSVKSVRLIVDISS